MYLQYLLALHSINGMGSQRLKAILEHYGWDTAMAWEDYRNWQEVKSFTREVAANLILGRTLINAEAGYESFLSFGASIITLHDSFYPERLKEIFDPPVLLFYKGELPQDDDICLAMVGSRRATAYGRQVAEILSRDLADEGIWVASGMARGIDSICHQSAIAAGGKTVAVLGSGLDVIYPPENKELYHQIIASGAVISELPLGAAPLARNFPMRNRIISGLSRGVMVIEAGEKSGTLLTVDRALEQGRDIFAVPGPITSSLSKGTNNLIRQGAKPVTIAQDVWEEYYPESRRQQTAGISKKAAVLSPEEKQLFELLQEPLHFDVLAERLEITPQRLASLLTVIEIRGLVRQLPGKYYVSSIRDLK